MKKKQRKIDPFFKGYSRVDTGDVVTFGTTVWKKDDGFGIIIVFPTGQTMKYSDEDTKASH